MPGKVTLAYLDAGGQRSTVSLHHQSLSAANIDAIVGANGDIDDLVTAIGNLTIGQLAGVKSLARDSDSSSTPSSAPEAQREMKWLGRYSDDVSGDVYQFEIPCPDITNSELYTPGKEKEAVMSHANWGAFKTAFEVLVRSKTGAAVTFLGAKLVGRNL